MKYTDIFLDLDDTLIDTAESTRVTVGEIYKDYNFGNYFPSFDDFYAIYYANVSRFIIAKSKCPASEFQMSSKIRTLY
ncbi:MAG: hypothetical protein ACK5M3_08935 [Dysgonomonas sp.]